MQYNATWELTNMFALKRIQNQDRYKLRGIKNGGVCMCLYFLCSFGVHRVGIEHLFLGKYQQCYFLDMSSTCLGHLPLQLIYVLGRTRFVVFNYWYLKQLALTHTYCVVFGSPSYKEYSFTQTTEGKSHNKALFSLWLCSSLAEA